MAQWFNKPANTIQYIDCTAYGSLRSQGRRTGSASSSLYNAAITAFAISAVPLLPPNSIGLIPSA
jgi:hypothetical protein